MIYEGKNQICFDCGKRVPDFFIFAHGKLCFQYQKWKKDNHHRIATLEHYHVISPIRLMMKQEVERRALENAAFKLGIDKVLID